MNTMTAEKVETLDVCFGTYPHTQPLKNGDIKSDRVALRFNEVNPINKAFLMMVRQMKFDVSEMAIATYLQAKAYGKPMVLMPATMFGRFQHGTMLYNSERGTVTPDIMHARNASRRPRSTIPPASTNASGLRCCAPRWRRPSSVQPEPQAACRA